MAKLDNLLFWIFLTIILLCLSWSGYAFYKAFTCAERRDDPDGLRMFFWACGGLAGLVVAGMSAAYVFLPIVLYYWFD